MSDLGSDRKAATNDTIGCFDRNGRQSEETRDWTVVSAGAGCCGYESCARCDMR